MSSSKEEEEELLVVCAGLLHMFSCIEQFKYQVTGLVFSFSFLIFDVSRYELPVSGVLLYT